MESKLSSTGMGPLPRIPHRMANSKLFDMPCENHSKKDHTTPIMILHCLERTRVMESQLSSANVNALIVQALPRATHRIAKPKFSGMAPGAHSGKHHTYPPTKNKDKQSGPEAWWPTLQCCPGPGVLRASNKMANPIFLTNYLQQRVNSTIHTFLSIPGRVNRNSPMER